PLSTPKSQTPRNAPCPCGSGKKYKRCCGSSDL
ncbi:MAG: SEC-C domain-containing protein, partial [Verrucomicrobia bacterium]|nr:SEC-C domain-containing protein [Verrucomicrobiota bacterium]MBU4496430.1 SEC-C domain-containing protein [Verrucomicrobiota bacterium]